MGIPSFRVGNQVRLVRMIWVDYPDEGKLRLNMGRIGAITKIPTNGTHEVGVRFKGLRHSIGVLDLDLNIVPAREMEAF